MSLAYRWTFAASLICALVVALLWGGNIGAVYPLVEIAFQKHSPRTWVDSRIAAAESQVGRLREESARLTRWEEGAEEPDERRIEREALAGQLKVAQQVVSDLENSPSRTSSVDTLRGAAESSVRELQEAIASLDRREEQGAPLDAARRESERAKRTREIDEAERNLGYYRWLREHVVIPYLPEDSFRTLVLFIGLLMVGTVVKSLFFVFHQILCYRLAQLTTLNLRREFYRRTLRMDLASFGEEGTSELMSRFTNDMESLSSAVNEFYGKLVREPLKMLACLIGAGIVCWRLLVLSLVLAPLTAFIIRWLARALKRANRRAMEEMSQLYGVLEETFQGIKVVKAFTMERHERRRFHEISKKYYRKTMRIARYDALTRPMTEVLGVTTICVALLAGAYLVLNQETRLFGVKMCSEPMSLSALFMFYGLLAGVSDPARKLSEVFSRIQRGVAASDRVFRMLDRESRVVDPVRGKPLPRHSKDLVFENVDFHYVPSRPVLSGIDLRIEAGETIAIVGPNGCGKSSLANLIPRFFDPVAGRVRLDGVDLREAKLRRLREQIGLVTQETLLFDDTVANNIRYGSPNATPLDARRAAQQAHAHAFIEEKLAQGYDTMVGARGSQLSGGQRQRIALARAILRDPAILILDEATSQVDLESEHLIQRVLERFTRDRTTILITHRMATLALADRIVVMEAGRISDIGRHDELLRRCDLYSRLHSIQFKEIA